jgi:hypothetical protein
LDSPAEASHALNCKGKLYKPNILTDSGVDQAEPTGITMERFPVLECRGSRNAVRRQSHWVDDVKDMDEINEAFLW